MTAVHKMYAKAMERLATIHDGSTGECGNGYWVVNVAAVSPLLRLTKYRGGAIRVWLPKEHTDCVFKKPLWLVRLTRKNGQAESWYVCDIPAETEEDAFKKVMEGYGCRWTIEEVHRQIKTDYCLEAVQLQRYQALKNFNSIFWTAAKFWGIPCTKSSCYLGIIYLKYFILVP